VLSGDTVVLLGRGADGKRPPEVTFTFERVTAPRMASKANNNVDDPGAFSSREWLRNMCVGKTVTFETRKQGATAGDRVYGLLFMPDPADKSSTWNLSVESVRRGFCTPKVLGGESNGSSPEEDDNGVEDYEQALQGAYKEAVAERVGVHAAAPLVRKILNAGDDFSAMTLYEKSKRLCTNSSVTCVIEYVFDGSRYRCIVTDPELESAGLMYASFTLILAGVACPRVGNPRLNPPTPSEPFAVEARDFVELRLLQRELKVTLNGTDKSGVCLVGTVHHPRGNIGAEVLKNGLGRISDWTIRMMSPGDVPPLRIAENTAKRSNLGVFVNYTPPTLTGASEFIGTVVEVISGDTLMILPNGEVYDSESKLKKVSLASVRAPRAGNEKTGKEDEPYATECKDRLRVLTVGKTAKVNIHYEKEIPIGQNKTEKRQFGTISVGKRADIGEVLITEGLATTQRHRDDDEKSSRYDELVAAESIAKASNKGMHSSSEYKPKTVNDLSDPKKAKTYASTLQRAGMTKAVVDYCFNGSRFKLFVPSENCYIMFALSNIRCPQPSPNPGSKNQTKAAEPFGDNSKRHSRLNVMQRTVEINCTGVTMGGVMTGDLYVGTGAQRRDYSIELVASGLASVDQRKIDYGEAPKVLVETQTAAQNNKLGIWSIEQVKKNEPKIKTYEKAEERTVDIQISEICNGNTFFFRVVGDESAQVIDNSMKIFTEQNGTDGAPCDIKVGKIVAALFNDGSSNSWYRAKILEKLPSGKVKVLFIDHGNVAAVKTASQCRPLDVALGIENIPAAAKEAQLAMTKVRDLSDDDGIEAARYFQRTAWGKDIKARLHGESDGKVLVTLYESDVEAPSINENMVAEGFAIIMGKKYEIFEVLDRMGNSDSLAKLVKDIKAAQEKAKSGRKGMWVYGEIAEEDED
jgi:staphylococcal nuclease domain-containing protein 1